MPPAEQPKNTNSENQAALNADDIPTKPAVSTEDATESSPSSAAEDYSDPQTVEEDKSIEVDSENPAAPEEQESGMKDEVVSTPNAEEPANVQSPTEEAVAADNNTEASNTEPTAKKASHPEAVDSGSPKVDTIDATPEVAPANPTETSNLPAAVAALSPTELEIAAKHYFRLKSAELSKKGVEARKAKRLANMERVHMHISKNGASRLPRIAKVVNLSPQMASSYLCQLVREGRLVATGWGKNRTYKVSK